MVDMVAQSATLTVSISSSQYILLKCTKGSVTIGRSSKCDLILPDKSVSRLHTRIMGTNHGYFIEDMSKNGTFINGIKITKSLLEKDSEIQIGPYSLYFNYLSSIPDSIEEPPTSRLSSTQKDNSMIVKGKPIQTSDTDRESLHILGKSRAIINTIELMKKVASADLPVLISGETGTGKELVAKGIHQLSYRNTNTFVAVNCSAIARELVESELFGHEKGSFTGATYQKKGAFEIASGGTLFLDEIGEMPLDIQAKLLRVIEGSEISRVGNTTPIKVNVRILTATNRILEKEVKRERFRKDLFYRLNAFPINIPALRERGKDVNILSRYFLSLYNNQYGTNISFSNEISSMFEKYPWPGNVRELKNVVFRAAILSNKDEINKKLISQILPDSFLPLKSETSHSISLPYLRKIDRAERETILHELANTGWNKTQTAKNLGISKSTLFEKLKKYQIRNR